MRGLSILFVGVVLGACGNDHKSRHDNDNDIIDRDSPFDPVEVAEQCTVSANCEDGDRCTENRCIAFECVAIPIPSDACCDAITLFEENFDGTLNPNIDLSSANEDALWSVVDEAATSSPPAALYFGDPIARTYNKGTQVAGTVTLPEIELPKDRKSVLSMRVYAAIEPTIEYDLFWVEAVVERDTTVSETITLFTKRDLPFTAFQDFALVDVPLDGLEGEVVRLVLRFDSRDGNANGFEGVYVDDVRVEGLCPIPPPCTDDAECDKGDACIAAACAEVGCVETDICEEEEPNPCDAVGAPDDCCSSDAECDDNNPTTIDVCDGASCVHNVNPDACTSDESCNDNEACTVDTCIAATATCSYTGKIGPGCCEPGTNVIANFDAESLQGIYVTDNFETGVFWRTDKTRATSGEFSLYCGEPVAQTYAAGERVKSSATTRPLAIAKGGTTTLELDLFKATRTAKNWDVFQVFALRDGALFPLWSSRDQGETAASTWQHLSISLADYAGTDLQIRFVFDSVDGITAPFEGTYIDTIQLITTCQ